MPFPDPPLSRRAVMRSAAIAPVILLGRKAWAQPTDEAKEKLALVTRSVPPAQLQAILIHVAQQDPDVDPVALELVARSMWAHFIFGTGGVDVPDNQNVMWEAYVFKGGIVVNNVKDGNFDPFGNDYLTNFCCYVCGHKAAMIAIQGIDDPTCGPAIPSPTPPATATITPAIYKCAWTLTQKEMQQKLNAARANGSAAVHQSLGNGC